MPTKLRPDGTYLITGGLGGLGLTVARWMVTQGAQHIVLMGRSEPSTKAHQALTAIREAGGQVVVVKGDVAEEQGVASVLTLIDKSMPPLRGIIHAAGILDDGILLRLDHARFKTVMAPKLKGAWNLHALTLNESLDFFVLFSSVASLFGSPGQGNHAAANAFLDALTHYRRAQGRPALSINWGPWAEVGQATRPEQGKFLASHGIGSILPEQGVQVLERLLGQDAVQVAVVPVDWKQWQRTRQSSGNSPLFAYVCGEQTAVPLSAGGSSDRVGLTGAALRQSAPEERQQLLESYLREQVAGKLGLARLNVHQPLNQLGIDSLIAIELKNRIETDLGLVVPVMQFLQGPSVAQLATWLADELAAEVVMNPNLRVSSTDESDSQKNVHFTQLPEIDRAQAVELLARLPQLSDESVDDLLQTMLATKEDKNDG